MKKNIISFILLIIFLVSCGENKPKIYSFQEKEVKMVIAVFENNETVIKEIEKDIESWNKLSQDNVSGAKEEYSEWLLIKNLVDEHHAKANYLDAKQWLEKNK